MHCCEWRLFMCQTRNHPRRTANYVSSLKDSCRTDSLICPKNYRPSKTGLDRRRRDYPIRSHRLPPKLCLTVLTIAHHHFAHALWPWKLKHFIQVWNNWFVILIAWYGLFRVGFPPSSNQLRHMRCWMYCAILIWTQYQ